MYDAIVVGARCAGSPTAMLLARKGYRVLLVDSASFRDGPFFRDARRDGAGPGVLLAGEYAAGHRRCRAVRL
jgi:flavin-dependent dehydrogenase